MAPVPKNDAGPSRNFYSDLPGEEIYLTGISGSFPESDSVKHLAENLFNKVKFTNNRALMDIATLFREISTTTMLSGVIDLITDDERRWKNTHPDIPQRTGKINNISKFDASFFGIHYKQGHIMDPMCRILLEKAYECIIDAGVNPAELRNTKTGVFVGACFSESEKTWVYEKMQVNDYGNLGSCRGVWANRISQFLGVTGPSYTVETACSSTLYALENAVKAIRDGLCDSAIVGGGSLCLHPFMSLQFSRLGVLSTDGRCKSFDQSANGYTRAEAISACFLQKAKDSRRVYAQIVHAKINCDGFKEEGITYPAGNIQKLLLRDFYDECGVDPSTLEFVEAHGTGTRVGDPEELKAIDEIFTKGRSEPLLIGSVKSNLGHTEPTAGLCSLAKLCIAYHTGYIPPNINFNNPRTDVAGFKAGRLEVVTEKRPWGRGMSGISSFGFGGANSHALLKNVARDKVNNGLPSDSLPRLVCVSGRTESAVAKILDDLASRTVDAEEVRLWHAIHEKDIIGHNYRGFTVLRSTPTKSINCARDIQSYSNEKRPVWFVYAGADSQWARTTKQLMNLPIFAAAIETCHNALKSKGFDLLGHIANPQTDTVKNTTLIGNTALQIGLTDVLRTVGITPDHIIGHGVTELCCAYVDGCLSAEQVILATYASVECPTPDLLCALKELIPSPKLRSKRWLSTSVPKSQWEATKSTFSSADYHYTSVTSPVLGEASQQIETNAIVIEISSSGALRTVPGTKQKFVNINLTDCYEDNLIFLLTKLGHLYEAGLILQLANLYPQVPFPVSQGTPMLSHLVEWEHREDWVVTKHTTTPTIHVGERTVTLSLQNEDYEFLAGHVVDGRIIVPGTCYLILVWETLGMLTGRQYAEVSVVFEDVCLHRATRITENDSIEFTIMIHQGTGEFEIVENGKVTVVTGRIYEKKNLSQDFRVIPSASEIGSSEFDSKIMSAKNFYKECNLRGLQYTGIFRGVQCCNVGGTKARLLWLNNWVSFLDTVLQVNMTALDSRLLYVPTRIEKLSIDVKLHYQILSKQDPSCQQTLDCRIYPDIEVTRTGGVELRGMHFTAISKKPPLGIPVFEKNLFVSNYSNMVIGDILRTNLQLVLENIQTFKFKSIELVDDEYKAKGLKPVIEIIGDVLADMPLVQAELLVISEDSLEMPPTVTVAKKKLAGESNAIVFIGANLLRRSNILEEGFSVLRENCFVLSRETDRPDTKKFIKRYDIVTVYYSGIEYFVLLRKKTQFKPTKYVKIVTTDESFSWVEKLRDDINDGQTLVLYNENETINGFLGLVNCLRKEPGGEAVHGLMIADPKAPAFSPELKFYKDQIDKGLAINVLKDGQWGTYRHILLEDLKVVHTPHAFVNVGTIGDLSSLRWFEGPLSPKQVFKNPDSALVHVYCSALNFRDVMTAMGRVTVDAVARGRIEQECVQGLEIAGMTANGTRVMGISQKAISNLVKSDKDLLWCIPDEWSFEEAATVPVAYSTVLMALVMIGNIQRGESILIHAGSGGVGQAAISIALHHGMEIFTTVGTPTKRAFIKKLFPQLKDSHIGNSRDTSFVEMIHRETNGRGVDVVLNSLADDKLQASAKCLAHLGRFLEIGKYDITNNTLLEMCFFKKEISFHGVMLDYVHDAQSAPLRKRLRELLIQGIQTGAIRPLTHCTFEKNQVEQAYRYMAAGRHVGKVIIKIREEEPRSHPIKPTTLLMEAVPRYSCNEEDVYVLVGGLGGFGLELVDWLVLRGARKLVLTSRRGISNGYQALRLKVWSSYGADIRISTHDVTTESGCHEMLKLASSMGRVTAIFNLAVILKDAVFTNQTPESFRTSFKPKALATMHLDKLSRIICPELKDFVVFSSVSCGRGNAGQTNYGLSNSVMERICELRKNAGLPALAIQWGAVGDVGLVADMQEENVQIEIGGTLQQRITSCLQAMDKFMIQNAPIVSSIVVAEKRVGGSGSGNMVDAISQIIGITDLKTVSLQVPLTELGMDSIMAVEIKQTLEREFEVFLTAQEIRMLSLSKLMELSAQRDTGEQNSTTASKDHINETAGLHLLMKNFGDEDTASLPFIYMPTLATDGEQPVDTIFMLPGLESCAGILEPFCRKLNARACVMQLGLDHTEEDIPKMAQRLYKIVKPRLTPGAPFYLLGYSFGGLPIMLLAAKLESEGHGGVVMLIDSSPDFVYATTKSNLDISSDLALENNFIIATLNLLLPKNEIAEIMLDKLNTIESYEDRIKYAMDMTPIDIGYSKEFLMAMSTATINRLKQGIQFHENEIRKLKSPIILLRPKQNPPQIVLDEKYGLEKFTESTVSVHCVEADHINIVENVQCAEVLNKVLADMKKHSKSKVLSKGST